MADDPIQNAEHWANYAEDMHRRASERQPVVTRVAVLLREIREKNHFGAAIRTIFEGDR